jgi:hypothetical protein
MRVPLFAVQSSASALEFLNTVKYRLQPIIFMLFVSPDEPNAHSVSEFAMDWIKFRILLKKLEAQLRYDVLPDGDERAKLSALIAECEECLAGWNGIGQQDEADEPNSEIRVRWSND